MDERELNFIAETEWKQYLEDRADPKNKKRYDFSDKLFFDLNALGYDIQWGFSLQPSVFNGDERIFPIVKKYVTLLEESDYCKDYIGIVSLLVHCMAHKKCTFATEWLLEKYRYAVKNNIFFELTNSYADTITTIKDNRYIDEYINLCMGNYLCADSGYFVQLLGKLKVVKAENLLIELIDYRAKPNCQMGNECFYNLGLDLFVSEMAVKSLGLIKSTKAIPKIKECLNPEKLQGFSDKGRTRFCTEMRNIAQKAIAKIEK